jgi:hypothetical protein
MPRTFYDVVLQQSADHDAPPAGLPSLRAVREWVAKHPIKIDVTVYRYAGPRVTETTKYKKVSERRVVAKVARRRTARSRKAA